MPIALPKAAADYLERDNPVVNGWLWPTTALAIASLLAAQTAAGMAGDVLEIGVHHGKLFILLANSCAAGETATAVDVFDDQSKNLDGSGAGDRAVFEANLRAYVAGTPVEIIQASSLELEQRGFLSRRFRCISIDGGHTAAVTVNDLRLAERTLMPGGVVALDDVLNPEWTGVLTGFAAYVAAGGTLEPFAHVPNKLLLTTPGEGARYRAFLRVELDLALVRRGLEFVGGEIDGYNQREEYDRSILAGLRRTVAAGGAAFATGAGTSSAVPAERGAPCERRDACYARLAEAQERSGMAVLERDGLRAELAQAQAERSLMGMEREHFRALLAAAQEARTQMCAERDQARDQWARAVAQLAAVQESALARAQGELSRLQGSASWRLTAPLRGGLALLRGRRPG